MGKIADTDLVALIKELSEELGAEYYCLECDREFWAEHEVTCCPYCGAERDGETLHVRNKLLGHVVPHKSERKIRQEVHESEHHPGCVSYEECPDCDGTGRIGAAACGLCEGDGEIFIGTHKPCDSCGGSGNDPVEGTCLSCGGTGAVQR